MVTHIVPWADQFPEWPNAAIEAYAMEEALLNPIEPAQIRNEVDFIRAIIGHKKQRTSDE
jgi:hypothetical protein